MPCHATLGRRFALGNHENIIHLAFNDAGTVLAASVTVVVVFSPLALAYDVASASSDVDLLSDTLGAKRKRGPSGNIEYEHAIRRIELMLDRENTKQGAGFVVLGRVIDMKTLGNILGALVSIGSTTVPIMWSLRPEHSNEATTPCALTEIETRTIRAAISHISCSYNMTIDEVIRGGN